MACYIGHSSSVFVLLVLAVAAVVVVSSLGGNFPAIRAHSLRLFLQAPFFLSQLQSVEARESDNSYSSFATLHCSLTP